MRIVILTFTFTLALCGQQTATLSGRVVDPTGAAVGDATVLMTTRDTQVQRTTRSDATGGYRLESLPPGDYLGVARRHKHGGIADGGARWVDDAAR